jgi:hypothetical protein
VGQEIALLGSEGKALGRDFIQEKALIGLVACESERHTAVNIAKWTKEALESIGLTEAGLLGEEK